MFLVRLHYSPRFAEFCSCRKIVAPITAIINGKAQPPFKVDRSLNKLLDGIFKYRDPGMLFTTEKTFVVPIEKADKSKDAKGDSPTPK